MVAIDDGNDVGMNVRTPLIQMDNEGEDVFLPVSATQNIVHIPGPFLPLWTSLDGTVVRSLREIYLLIAKGEFSEPVMRAADDEVNNSSYFGLITILGVRILDST